MHAAQGFVFPNDLHVHWSLMIVLYPYITGLVAGAFIVSSLYHVFDIKALKPVASFALIAALGFMIVAPMPLLLHLGHPINGMQVMITPNFSSAMAGFGVFYTAYLIILVLEVWLVFRKDIVTYARQSRGLKRFIYKALALGVYDISEEAQHLDHRVVTVLAAVGIPGAFLLHGYVGFLFGSVKANPWWSTPLMPVIFIFSAVVSGVAAIIIGYQIVMKLKGYVIDRAVISALCRWLWLFMILAVGLETLEIIQVSYESAEEWEIIRQLLFGPMSFSYVGLQLIVGSLIPFILLMIIVLMDKSMSDKVINTLSVMSSFLLLIQVLAMRWNVVIGGQMISKSLSGLREPVHIEMFGKEGLIAGIALLILPVFIILVAEWLLPMFRYSEEQTKKLQEEAAFE